MTQLYEVMKSKLNLKKKKQVNKFTVIIFLIAATFNHLKQSSLKYYIKPKKLLHLSYYEI